MNEQLAQSLPNQPATTQAAEGLPRRAWSLADIEAMGRAGIIGEDERIELIGGEVVPMLPKGGRHEMVKMALNWHFQRTASTELWVAQETTLRLDDKTFLVPDFCVFPRSVAAAEMRGTDVVVAIEVSDTSLAYDLGRKVLIYAASGVPEVWVINANTLVTSVHRQPAAGGFQTVFQSDATAQLVAEAATSITFCLDQLGLQPL